MDLFDRAQTAAASIQARCSIRPSIGIILGSGFGGFGERVEGRAVIPYSEIPHFPQSTVPGHSGNLMLGEIRGVPVAVMQGRVHAYEGYAPEEVVFPTRVLGLLGCRTLVVTNAAGGIHRSFRAGQLVLLADHINMTGINAAAGPNVPRFAVREGAGQRFFDMSSAYAPRLRELAREVAREQGLDLPEGVYLGVFGPSFETPAEIRAFRTLGADVVGMSTVHEVIVARHMGMEVLGLSLVTNPGAGVSDELIDHNEVMAIGRESEQRFADILLPLLPLIQQETI